MHQTGQTLGGRYRLDQRIGAGGMGEVWRATDLVLGRTVAVKVVLAELLDDPEFVRRFLVEAQAMASVKHPGVVAIHDFHGDEAGAYLVMEYVDGESLAAALGRLGRLNPTAAMNLVAQAAEALQAVHDRGIVHRDVKPANLLVRADGTVALTDFGIALAAGRTQLTQAGAVLGTPSYLAPEQVLGQPATPRSDVYALGVVAFECLAGRRPFAGDNPFAVAMRRIHEPAPRLPADVPPPMAEVVDRSLITDPNGRWSTAAELAWAARRSAEGVGHGARSVPGHAGRSRRWVRPVALVAAAAVLVAVGVVAAAAFRVGGLSLGGRTPQSPAAVPLGNVGPTTAGPGAPDRSPGGARGVPAGFAVCGTAFCPQSPLCWDGLVSIGGVAQPPRAADCAGRHVWETFAVEYLPADAVSARQDELMDRPDIANLCSAAALAARSRDPAQTGGWDRDVWPIQLNADTVLLHCIVHGKTFDTFGSVIKPA